MIETTQYKSCISSSANGKLIMKGDNLCGFCFVFCNNFLVNTHFFCEPIISKLKVLCKLGQFTIILVFIGYFLFRFMLVIMINNNYKISFTPGCRRNVFKNHIFPFCHIISRTCTIVSRLYHNYLYIMQRGLPHVMT